MSGPPDGEPTATPDPASGQASDPCPGGPANASGCSAVPDLAATLTPAPVPPRRSQRGWGGLQRLATAGGGRRARPRRPGRAGPWAAGTLSGWSPWSRPGRRLPLAACCCTWTCGPQPAHPDQGDGGGLPLGRHRGGLGRPAAAAKRPRPGRPPTRVAVWAASGRARCRSHRGAGCVGGLPGAGVPPAATPGLPGLRAFQQDHSRPASRHPIVVEVSQP
jgi:hypothetical protein